MFISCFATYISGKRAGAVPTLFTLKRFEQIFQLLSSTVSCPCVYTKLYLYNPSCVMIENLKHSLTIRRWTSLSIRLCMDQCCYWMLSTIQSQYRVSVFKISSRSDTKARGNHCPLLQIADVKALFCYIITSYIIWQRVKI